MPLVRRPVPEGDHDGRGDRPKTTPLLDLTEVVATRRLVAWQDPMPRHSQAVGGMEPTATAMLVASHSTVRRSDDDAEGGR